MDHGVSFPTHATTGESSSTPSVSSFASFYSFPHPENGVAATWERGGRWQHPRAGRGARRGPAPGAQGEGIRGAGPRRAPAPPALAMGPAPRPALVWGLGLFFDALASSAGRIPRADGRRRDNQPPRREPAKPRGFSCALRQGKWPLGTPDLPPGLRLSR